MRSTLILIKNSILKTLLILQLEIMKYFNISIKNGYTFKNHFVLFNEIIEGSLHRSG